MPPADDAVITVELDRARLSELDGIPGVKSVDRPEWVSYPDVVRVAVVADSTAQDAIRGLGFPVEIAITAEDYQAQIDDVFASAREESSSPREPA
jgi:hypothetical protein